MATASHEVSSDGDQEHMQDCRYFMDFDMSILGAPRAAYNTYMTEVKAEYQILLGRTTNPRAWDLLWARKRPSFMFVLHSRLFQNECERRSMAIEWPLHVLRGRQWIGCGVVQCQRADFVGGHSKPHWPFRRRLRRCDRTR